MESKTGKKIGIILFKLMLTVVAFLMAAGIGGKLSKAISSESYTSVSMAYVFMISAIIPIWYRAPTRWRFSAVGAGIAAGVITWAVSLFVGSSVLVGFFRAGAIVVSLVICVLVIHKGRSKRVG